MKLSRSSEPPCSMYIVSKLTSLPKCAPPPPPTAEHLLKTRPPSFIAAPSYDQLCVQIRDVQRQYTCGTGHERPSSGRAASLAAVAAQRQQTNLNSYISGLDGPSLEGVVNTTDLPVALVSKGQGWDSGCVPWEWVWASWE